MIAISDEPLSAAAAHTLAGYQAEVDAHADFEGRVELARSNFRNRNRVTNPVFREIREVLTRMCSGARRCMYCEDSCADEVEHHHPVRWYPGKAFEWMNYLYACGGCNGPKNSKFAVLDVQGLLVVVRSSPPPGDSALLHPRNENPLHFLMLDLQGTFLFVPVADAGTVEHTRASYTIQLLRLNERTWLPAARGEAYGSYRARLKEYIAERDRGAQTANLIRALQRMHHPTVWQEKKRQHQDISELKDLFTQAPEALAW